jgi:hypothetical protein
MFLQHPGVAIRIGELGKTGIVSTRGVEPGRKTSIPRSNGRLVHDLADLNPTFEQAASGSLKVRNDEIDVAK